MFSLDFVTAAHFNTYCSNGADFWAIGSAVDGNGDEYRVKVASGKSYNTIVIIKWHPYNTFYRRRVVRGECNVGSEADALAALLEKVDLKLTAIDLEAIGTNAGEVRNVHVY